ncbi:FAD-dependent monooxygenase [Saccharothrix syringae]|uniref:2-polyprenyl-6-methoxyphenol hydroxylase n=1 Tax=Saccharothrix syringae TaxID=103733 RepID=A0A5Q0GXB0_SACSY|nr:FAD-dependent monooxygenase [Saccharothrix syringae]QFZ18716.1 2-polyprenyl-6-methoxyphenol hydroxylase [Saccharothrix syringae]
MTSVRAVLVVGAGAAGTATAVRLAEAGVEVDVVEREPDVGLRGAGITLQRNALRVLRDLGVWERVRDLGYAFDGVALRSPDGGLLVEADDRRAEGEDLPATLGMRRPDLARVLVDRAREAGAAVRTGVAFTGLAQDEHGVDVTFDDGSSGRYDLVVGADGIRSSTRRAVGIDVEPRPTGMGIWRVTAPRPAGLTRTELVYGGPCFIAGYCPTGSDTIYAYLVERARDRTGLDAGQRLEVVRGLAAGYGGHWGFIREHMGEPNYTWFESHVLERPWHRGRVVLVGDAAHSCPPTLAQGAAQALEDAWVLTELLLAADRLDEDLWRRFGDRRHDRATAVVDASVQIAQWLLDGERGDMPGLMGRIATMLQERP